MKTIISSKVFLGKIHQRLEKFLQIFNIGFFLVSIAVWLYLTVVNLFTQPFQIYLFWDAFNAMYGQISFKVGCIVLIIFNGLQTIQGYLGYYYNFKEYHQHISTLGKIAGKNSHK